MDVLVVDDSVVFRSAIKSALQQSGQVASVKSASNGKIAVDFLKQGSFDAMTLDLEMPVMDGVETIKAVREFNKDIPIIIFSSQNINAANKTLKALELGANDFVQKIEGNNLDENLKMIQSELLPKFNVFLEKQSKTLVSNQQNVSSLHTPKLIKPSYNCNLSYKKPDLICIGASTGGPDTLKKIFMGLKENIKTPLIIVQHMPPIFTKQLAKSLNTITSFEVKEAQDGDLLEPGNCYIAPGDFHMTVENEQAGHTLRLNQGEKVCYVRPAVDVTFNSVATNFSGTVASFILTGMGSDGANGCAGLKAMDKGPVFIQDEQSSVVFGMPKAVFDLELHDEIANIEQIAKIINAIT